MNKLKSDYWPRPSFCMHGLQAEAKPVTLNDVQGAYYVMTMLGAVALVVLLSERILINAAPLLKTLTVMRPSGASSDVTRSNGDVTAEPHRFQYSPYFASFATYETHEMRSVRHQQSDHNRKQSGANDVTTAHQQSNAHYSMWTYDNPRRNIFTYTDNSRSG